MPYPYSVMIGIIECTDTCSSGRVSPAYWGVYVSRLRVEKDLIPVFSCGPKRFLRLGCICSYDIV